MRKNARWYILVNGGLDDESVSKRIHQLVEIIKYMDISVDSLYIRGCGCINFRYLL